MTDQPRTTLDYGRTDRTARFDARVLLRYLPVLVAGLGLLWSLSLRSHLVLSKGGVVGGNHAGMVLSMAKYSQADNWDLVPYTHRALGMGFHRVDWSRWTRNGKYLLVPKWVFLAITGTALVGSIAIAVSRRAAG